MDLIPTAAYVARHAIELQGLRTALLGAVCLLLAIWHAFAASYGFNSPPTRFNLPIILLGAWYCDERLASYYRRRVGDVRPLRPIRRILGLATIGMVCFALLGFEATVSGPFSVTALLFAGVQLHIGVISGAPHRKHYIVGGAAWLAFAWLPLLQLGELQARLAWLTATGFTLVGLGLLDHGFLVRSIVDTGDVCDGEESR